MAKKKKSKKKKEKSSGMKINFKAIFLLLVAIVFTILYLPSAILFFVGMLPTFVAYFTDKRPGKNKTFTIGALNFSGCFFYFIKIWSTSHPMDVALTYLSDPMTIVVIYTAAGLGYLINYFTTIIVASILRKKSLARLEKLEEKKKKMEERWGKKVDGKAPLNEHGFPFNTSENPVEKS